MFVASDKKLFLIYFPIGDYAKQCSEAEDTIYFT